MNQARKLDRSFLLAGIRPEPVEESTSARIVARLPTGNAAACVALPLRLVMEASFPVSHSPPLCRPVLLLKQTRRFNSCSRRRDLDPADRDGELDRVDHATALKLRPDAMKARAAERSH